MFGHDARIPLSSCRRIISAGKTFQVPTDTKIDSVYFTTKGQVVIPVWLRRQFDIQGGTRAIIQATADGILLRPVTGATLRRLRGILKRKPADKAIADEWAGHRAEELALEEAKHVRRTGSR